MKSRLAAALCAALLATPAAADWADAVNAYNAGDYATAAKEFRPFAENGQAQAQYILGWIYQNGEGVPQDYAESAKWYELAAKADNVDAQYALGSYYMAGAGVARDDAKAAEWFRKAAERGKAGAQYLLGYLLSRGEGVTRDDKEGAAWYRRAAEQGYAEAQYAVGLALGTGIGVDRDEPESNAWLRKAAEQGHVDASYLLGWNYAQGVGTLPDYTEAAKWYRQAAQSGNVEAQYQLATLLRDGRGVAKDEDAADALFRKAAEAGQASIPAAIDEYLKAGKFDRAVGLAEAWLAKRPDDVQLLTLLGVTAANEARTDPARFGPPAKNYGDRAIALIEGGKRPEGMSDVDWNEYEHKWLPQLHLRLGAMAQKAGRTEEARTRLEKMTRIAPKDPYGWYLLGQTHFTEYERINAQSKGLEGSAKSEAVSKAFGQLDKVIEFYARAVGLTDGREDLADLRAPLMKDLRGIYEFRTGSRAGFDEMLAKYRVN